MFLKNTLVEKTTSEIITSLNELYGISVDPNVVYKIINYNLNPLIDIYDESVIDIKIVE